MTDSTEAANPSRRRFLASAALGSVAVGAIPIPAAAEAATAGKSKLPPPSTRAAAMERPAPADYDAEQQDSYFVKRPGSDVMVDIIRSIGIPYIAINSGSSFRGLHESINNYGGNANPQILTCLHEEQAVGLAHGYTKASGKIMAVMCHGTVGLQHAAMAVYNAYADRVPMVIIAAAHGDLKDRLSTVQWAHSAQDPVTVIRDYTKWDDTPLSLQGFAESFVRAIKIAQTPPMGPVVLIVDSHLQEEDASGIVVATPRLAPATAPLGDANAVRELAKWLVAAENPLLIADRLANTPAGMAVLIELAELLEAPVVDLGGRMNFPSDHYLNHTARRRPLVADADLIVGIEMEDMWGVIHTGVDTVHASFDRVASDGVRVATIGVNDLFLKSNYQSFGRYYPAELAISGDGEATLLLLVDEVKRAMTPTRKRRNDGRRAAMLAEFKKMRAKAIADAAIAWDAAPVSTARLCMELWGQIKDRPWALTVDAMFQSFWPQRLWDINQHHQFIGRSGAYGVGYGAPSSVGAALAHRDAGRLAVNIQSDGDFLYVPGVFWTAAHHKIPLLSVMHNNGGYHQEAMHLQRMASRRNRGLADSASVGNAFHQPAPDYAAIAKGLGVWSAGPVTDPAAVGPAITRALQVIDSGEPALIDVICQPR